MIAKGSVQIRQLTKQFQFQSLCISVLRSVNLEIEPGQKIAILGKSGSGKSTLLHLLAGLDVPTSGQLIVNGADLGQMNAFQLAGYRSREVAIVFQAFHLVSHRTALENVMLPMMFAKVPRRERYQLANHWLDVVGLNQRKSHRPSQLSGGERQRVAIARAMVNRPALLLADEPSGNLDSQTGSAVMEIILQQVHEHKMTMILVTHDKELAKQSADQMVYLEDGILIPSP